MPPYREELISSPKSLQVIRIRVEFIFFSHYFQRIRSGWSFSIFLRIKTTPTRLNGPITRATWIKVFIKGSKTAKQSIISTTATAITTNNLESESGGIKNISSYWFTCCFYLSISLNLEIHFNYFWNVRSTSKYSTSLS